MQSPDDLLLTSIKRNDIQNVLLALALRGNPNAKDRSRSTHAVYLALVAADPAAPGAGIGGVSHTSSSSTASLRALSTAGTTTASTATDAPNATPRKPFAIAELLLQNGANIPTDPAPIPLSQAAKLYLEYKTELKLGRNPSAPLASPAIQGQQTSATGGRDANGDSLSSLPSRAIGSSSGGGYLSSSASSFGSSATPLEKRDSRSLKRSSGGFGKIGGSKGFDALEGMVRK